MTRLNSLMLVLLAASFALAGASPVLADSRAPLPPPPPPTYADLVDLADAAPLIVRAQPRTLVAVEAQRAHGLRPGWGRYYVEARTEAVIFGRSVLGDALRYLVDVPLDSRGKPPGFKKKSVLLFARDVPGRPGELQLIAPDAQLLWDAALDARLRGILGELTAPGAPRRVTGVREAIHVAGNLAGEGETQLFLATADGEPAAITVARKPGLPPRWTVSFSELVGESGAVPQRETLGWYRLACFLPPDLTVGANLSGSAADRAAAVDDYHFVLAQLGSCPRNRK